ncbi:(d)CMP kinase [bacterium]|nr:(d)CMP kinase [bacterium]
MEAKPLTIAIDGFSSTGKSTLARQVAAALGYRYVDSGAMYRGVAWYGLERGSIGSDRVVDTARIIADLDDIHLDFETMPEGGSRLHVNGVCAEPAIRSMRVSEVVSQVSSITEVRRKLVEQQQRMGRDGGVVMDGRDIGTVVFPQAELKIYMTADPEVRARRRYDELRAKGEPVRFEEILDNLNTRDRQDLERLDSPLLKAADAIELDNTFLSPDEQFDWVMERVRGLNRG